MVRLKAGAFVAVVSALVLCGRASAQDYYWQSGETNSWYDSANWNDGETVPAFIENPSAGTDDLGFDLTALNTNVTSTVDGSTSINSITITGGGAGSSLLLNSTCGVTLDIATSLTNSANSLSPVEITVAISGTGSVTNNGGGTLTLSGDNTYTGGTFIDNGTIAVGSNSALGTGTAMLGAGTNFTTTDSG
ncbi:MAG TPA: autotransporter-associated beta strand repeat-containing protein, partial [Opitutaceae bacterium]